MKIHNECPGPYAKGSSVIILRTALFVMTLLCLSLFSCAPKEVVRHDGPEPYEGKVTVEALKQSVGFGNIRSIKALADVTIYKKSKNKGSMNGAFAYMAPRKMRIDLFGPFGLTVGEVLISGDLLQVSVPQKNVLYEGDAPEVPFAGLSKGSFRYEMAEEDDMHVLYAYRPDARDTDGRDADRRFNGLAARYYFDRTYLLNRAVNFYKDGSEVLRAEFDDFNGRVPERIKIMLSNGLAMDISLQESEFDADIPEEYFRAIEHGGRKIKSFEELLKTPFGKAAEDPDTR